VKASLFCLLAVLILACCAQASQQTRLHPASGVLHDSYRLGWKLPVGDLKSATVSQDGQKILLSAFFDGYYLYDSKGTLMWRLPDPYAGFGEFSADGNLMLLAPDHYLSYLISSGLSPGVSGREKVSLVDTSTLHEEWNYTLDRVDHAVLSRGSATAAIVGATRLPTPSFPPYYRPDPYCGKQKLLVVTDRKGTELLNLKFGERGTNLDSSQFGCELDSASAPSISYDGRYVAVGVWSDVSSWVYFVDLDSGKAWNNTMPNAVNSVALSSNGKVLATAGSDRLNLFNENGTLLWCAALRELSSPRLFVSSSGEYVAVAGGSPEDARMILFDGGGKELWSFQVPHGLAAFAVDKDFSRFVVGDLNGAVYVLDRFGTASSRSIDSEIRSVAVGGEPGTIVAVGDDNIMYVMNAQTSLLWKHEEVGPNYPYAIQTSQDGKRAMIGHSSGDHGRTRETILNDKGKGIFTAIPVPSAGLYLPPGVAQVVSAVSSNGEVLVILSGSVVAWYDVDAGRQVRNVTLDKPVYSLSMSHDADLVVVSGVVWNNYTFIEAFDSQGRKSWDQLFNAEELVGMHEFLHVHSNAAVSSDGSHVAAALREQSVRAGLVCAGSNGVVLFDKAGKLLWNYTTPECVYSVAVSEDGQYLVAGSISQLYGFAIDGRVLWSVRVHAYNIAEPTMVATSGAGQRFIAGDVGGRLFLGNASGPYWQIEVNGQVESVAISDSGDTSVAVISRDYPDARTARLLYVMNDKGSLVANYTFIGPTQATGGSRVAISGNACCIVAALETDGVYYFERIETQTTTIATLATSRTPSATASTPITSPAGPGIQQNLAMVALVGALGLAALLFIIKYRSRTRARGKVPAGPRAANWFQRSGEK